MKMNTLLAKVEHSGSTFSKIIKEYAEFFNKKQGMFTGIKKTFKPREGYIDNSNFANTTVVTTTVQEKLDWFESQIVPHLKNVFTIEATNASGAATTELIVDGISFGFLTALDLMRLKSLLTSKDLNDMYNNIPVRSDAEVWEDCTDAEYNGREIFQTPLIKGVSKTTESEEVILKDPNLDPAHLPSNYNARTTIKKKVVETGDYTLQNYSGQWTQRQRAELLRRKSQILEAVIEALKVVNDIEASKPNLKVDDLISFIHYGKK